MELLVVAAGLEGVGLVFATEAGGGAAGLQINFFWIIVSSLNCLLFLFILWTLALKPVSRMLNARRVRIEEGLRDAEQARRDRDSAQQEHIAALAEARREANDILTRAQRVAQETRDADLAATREELERLRQRASDEIEAEKLRAMAELRGEVADLALAAAGKVIGSSMTEDRQRRLVEEFLADARNVESRD
ncbi:MAG: F0F1 ATP synthase subunit B [Chloroflexi bacterium]|nr:F0F1 ATP synthase subunit B [Chloroflexota bacterium]